MPEQKANEPCYIYRLPPCPAYDVEGTESWLSAMAEKGFVLTKDGFLFGFATFEKTEPQVLRYRLEAAEQQISPLSDERPSEDAEELYASFGWRYVAARGQFRIYCADSDEARELNSDPRVQAIAFKMVRGRAFSRLLMAVFWGFVYPLLFFKQGVLRAMLSLPPALMVVTLVLLALMLTSAISQAVALHRIGKRLAQGEPLNHGKDWRKGALRYHMRRALCLIVSLAFLWCAAESWSADMRNENKMPLAEYDAALPFATIADFAPEGKHRLYDIGYSNTVSVASLLLAPTVIEYREYAHVTLPDGSLLQGGLDVEYYETASPLLARILAFEIHRAAKRAKHYAEYELPPLGVDYAVGYMEYFPTVVIQDGCRILCAMFYQTGEDTVLSYADWVTVMAETMLKKAE